MGETGNTQAVPVEAPQNGGLSFAGIFKVFYQPTAFFAKLKENPKILVPYLALAVLLLIFFLSTADLLVDFSMKAMRERASSAGQPLPPRSVMWGSTVIGGTVAMLLAPLIISLLAMFFGSFLMGSKARFKQVLSIVLYGEIIYGVGMVVTGLLMLLKNSIFVSLSAATFLSNPNPQSAIFVLLSKIGVFYIWELIVVGIGLSVIYGFSRNKGYMVSVISLGLLALIHVAWTALMG